MFSEVFDQPVSHLSLPLCQSFQTQHVSDIVTLHQCWSVVKVEHCSCFWVYQWPTFFLFFFSSFMLSFFFFSEIWILMVCYWESAVIGVPQLLPVALYWIAQSLLIFFIFFFCYRLVPVLVPKSLSLGAVLWLECLICHH